MLKFIILFLVSISILTTELYTAQCDTLSGVINTYHKTRLLSLCNGTLFLPQAISHLSVGQSFVLIQMQGAVADTSIANYGNILDVNGAGWYEVNSVRSIRGDTIECKNVFSNDFLNSDLSLQLIPIKQYTCVTIQDSVTAAPWNLNNLGGVVVLFADTIFLNGKITVDEKGFFGGDSSTFRDSCNVAFLGLPAKNRGISGQKGYGITDPDPNHMSGIGAMANAGGAGAAHNSGGGGGSNKTNGGKGGRQYSELCSTTLLNGGFGGIGMLNPLEPQRIFLGGGGGGGQQNNRLSTKGGAGGGIVIVKATTIFCSTSSSISANGQTARIGGNDGGGGGGAGGSIVLYAENITNKLQVNSIGGKGSTLRYTQHGAGGGSSGGVVITNDTSNVMLSINTQGGSGGIAGVDNLANEVHKGKNGEKGLQLQSGINSQLKVRRTVPLSLNQTVPDSICIENLTDILFSDNLINDLKLYVSNQIVLEQSFLRYTVRIDSTTTFKAIYNYDYDCVDSLEFTIVANQLPNNQLQLTKSPILCINDSVTISIVDSTLEYLWNTGDTTQSITVSKEGVYFVTVKNEFGCYNFSDTIFVSILPYELPQFSTTDSVVICSDSSVTIGIENSNKFTSYLWNTNDSSSSISVTTPGKYFVKVVNIDGCILYSDTIFVKIYSLVIENETYIAFDSVDIVNEKFQTITIQNNGFDPFEFSATLLHSMDQGFSTSNQGQSFQLLPNDSKQYEIRFFPLRQIEYTDSLEITILSPCPQIVYVPINGFGRGRFITRISLPDTTLSVFERNVTLPITIELSPVFSVPFSKLSFTVEIGGQCFAPFEDRNGNFTVLSNPILSGVMVESQQVMKFGTTYTIPIRGDVLLGSNQTNALTISNQFWIDNEVNYIDSIEVKNGSLQLSELCFEGGTRLLRSLTKTFSMTVNSTIVQEKVDVFVECKEVGDYTIRLFSLEGIELYASEFTYSLQDKTTKVISIPMNLFVNGMYILQCNSSTEIDRTTILKQ